MNSISKFLQRAETTGGSKAILPGIPEKAVTFISLFVISLFAYRNAMDVQVPTDSFLFMHTLQTYGAEGLMNNFYDIGLTPVADSILFVLFKVFGTHTTGWFLAAIFFHSLNAFLIILVSFQLNEAFKLNCGRALAYAAGLLFLLSPFQTEVILWTPRIVNYSIAAAFILLAFHYMIKYSRDKKNVQLLLLHFFFICAILSFETALCFPAIPACYFVLLGFMKGSVIRVKFILSKILLPQAAILFFYFLTCKLWLGEWILHYGASAHLSFSPALVAGTLVKYMAKFLLFYRYLPDSRREFLHDILQTDITHNMTVWVLLSVSILLGAFLFIRLYRINKNGTFLLLLLFLSFLITLVPVINLDTTFVGAIFTDRYGYLPSAFFYLFLATASYILLKRIWGLISCGLLVICCLCLSATIPVWKEASDYSKRLMANYAPFVSERTVFILNMPDNCDWIMTYRNGFTQGASLAFGKQPREIKEIAGFSMTSISDSVTVTYDGLKTLRVESMPRKKSFLYNGRWGKSLESADHILTFDEDLSSYTLTFKNGMPADASILYVAGDQWRKVKLK